MAKIAPAKVPPFCQSIGLGQQFLMVDSPVSLKWCRCSHTKPITWLPIAGFASHQYPSL